MNIERGITYLATFVTLVILLVYTLGLQNRLPFFAIGRHSSLAMTSASLPTQTSSVVQVADLQALAQYQATLPTYAATSNRASSEQTGKVEQIADLQALAAFQAASANSYHGIATQSGQGIVEQIANLQELAQYHATHAIYHVDNQSR